MSRLKALAKGASIAGVATVAVGGTAYALERFAVARLKRNPGEGTDRIFTPISLPTHSVATFDGGTLNVVDTGSRNTTTIVLMHGVTLSIRTWVLQLEELHNRGFRVVVFDHRGHGKSSLGTRGFAIENLGHDINSVLTALDLRDVVLVGHSMGGIAAQAYLHQYSETAAERLAGVVLLSTLSAALNGSQAARFGQMVERVTRRTPDSTRLWANPNIGMLLARFGFGKDPKASHIELVRQMMVDCPRHTRIAGPRSLIGFDLRASLPAIKQPTLVVGGTADVITPPRDSQRLHDAIRDSTLEIFDGGGHMLMLERSDALNDLIETFARKVGADV